MRTRVLVVGSTTTAPVKGVVMSELATPTKAPESPGDLRELQQLASQLVAEARAKKCGRILICGHAPLTFFVREATPDSITVLAQLPSGLIVKM